MSFVRENTYRLNVSPQGTSPRERLELTMSFGSGAGTPWVRVLIQKHHPERFIESRQKWVEASVEDVCSIYRYGRDVLEDPSDQNMAGYYAADALGDEAVIGRHASGFCHTVLWTWFVKGPEEIQQTLAKAAPDWWALIKR